MINKLKFRTQRHFLYLSFIIISEGLLPMIIGKGHSVHDAMKKATGKCKYVADMVLPEMAYMAIFSSPVANGIVRSIDVTQALAMEGVIEVLGLKNADAQNNNMVLKPGQKLTLRKGNEQYVIQNAQESGLSIPEEVIEPVKIKSTNLQEKANVELATAWTENKLVFVKERFGDVKTKLERWYGVTIEVKDSEILDYRFTGTFEKQTFEQAMNALSKAASCKFTIDKNHVFVSK